jgi:predicted metalloprotease with PDZ domain
MNARALGACGSALVHASLLLAFITPEPEAVAEVQAPSKAENDEMEMRLLPATDDGDGMACDGAYTGIGVVTTYSGMVDEVVPGGPADRAGMHIGDHWLNPETFARDQYSIGRQLVLRVERHGVRLDLPVRIGRVCFERGAQSVPHLKEVP